jgi:hypothetical protein
MSWLFSQALVEEYSAGTSLAGRPSAQLNVTPTQHKFWRNDKTMESSRLSQFGLTLQLLTEDLGEELLMSYLAASHARTSAQPAKALELMAPEAACGITWPASFAKYDPNAGSSWRTHQFSLLGGLDEFSATWPRWGSMRNGESYLRSTPMLSMSESASGLWPTPTVCGNYNRPGASPTSGLGLASAVRYNPSGKPIWRTPNASDASKWNKERIEDRVAKGRQIRLNNQISPDGSQAGQMNPEWVEWLMGWPIGWTELKPLAMARFREWQQQHGGF